jgi:hypothetical protein
MPDKVGHDGPLSLTYFLLIGARTSYRMARRFPNRKAQVKISQPAGRSA